MSEDKTFPAWGCKCDLDEDEPLTDCSINVGYIDDCTLTVTSQTKHGKPRYRRTPTGCKYWVKNEDQPHDH